MRISALMSSSRTSSVIGFSSERTNSPASMHKSTSTRSAESDEGAETSGGVERCISNEDTSSLRTLPISQAELTCSGIDCSESVESYERFCQESTKYPDLSEIQKHLDSYASEGIERTKSVDSALTDLINGDIAENDLNECEMCFRSCKCIL
ncbi:hypothetical protein ANCCAN_04905 [Ancylostoma caninum]|uniref:Uncharacterized protein n=1 Tax=Ancylostoma caninum TaxID=29170 RepID=A0A368GZR9_ANCCA|nr:hypothetical protein ANCCAN_04905 [Ancylostoma caninum]